MPGGGWFPKVWHLSGYFQVPQGICLLAVVAKLTQVGFDRRLLAQNPICSTAQKNRHLETNVVTIQNIKRYRDLE